jgi:xanthine/uracil/vitamin C permease (AzgA family)
MLELIVLKLFIVSFLISWGVLSHKLLKENHSDEVIPAVLASFMIILTACLLYGVVVGFIYFLFFYW